MERSAVWSADAVSQPGHADTDPVADTHADADEYADANADEYADAISAAELGTYPSRTGRQRNSRRAPRTILTATDAREE
jgi:hypothetical protein